MKPPSNIPLNWSRHLSKSYDTSIEEQIQKRSRGLHILRNFRACGAPKEDRVLIKENRSTGDALNKIFTCGAILLESGYRLNLARCTYMDGTPYL